MDFDASGSGEIGCLSLVVNWQPITAPGSFAEGEYHHLAVTYDDGHVTLYLDGEKIGAGTAPGGPVSLLVNLRVGTDRRAVQRSLPEIGSQSSTQGEPGRYHRVGAVH